MFTMSTAKVGTNLSIAACKSYLPVIAGFSLYTAREKPS